jgi:DNA topoisomerase-1
MPKTPSKTTKTSKTKTTKDAKTSAPASRAKTPAKAPAKKAVAEKPLRKTAAVKAPAKAASKAPAKAAAKRPAKKADDTPSKTLLAGKDLVIVESPAKARTLTGYLGSKYVVQATVGHVRDLPAKRLGVDVDAEFEPEYVVIEGKEDVVKNLRKTAKDVRQIYLATDPDREGEAIAFHVAELLGKTSLPLQRVLFNEITRSGVLKAMAHPIEIDTAKVDAQQARRVLDRLVGYLVSPLLQKIIARGLSAGRVQSVALRLICEREDEIRAFVREEYWTVEALLLTAKSESFLARLVKMHGQKPELGTEESAAAAVAEIRKHPFALSDLKVKPTKSHPSAPYTTSTLQQDASRRLGFSNERTMGVAQALYEGVNVGGKDGLVGLITYMRTDSTRLAPESVTAVRDYIAEQYGVDYVPDKPRMYESKKSAQDAHEAIRPTDVTRTPQSLKKALTPEQAKLYELIWRRFVACQMADAQFEVTTATLMAGPYEFRATGRRTLFTGHLQALAAFDEEKRKASADAEEDDSSRDLPKLEVGKSYKLDTLTPSQHFTEPPPRYNAASLVKTLDELGIGRPSTYASIISVLSKRRYIELRERRFHPTTLGETVSKMLVEQFPDIFNVDFTAKMEEELDSVENGQNWREVVQDFYTPFSKRLAKVNKNRHELKQASETVTDKSCPDCGSPLILKWGRAGQFLGCSNYPECRHTEPLESEKPPETPVTDCPNCGKPMAPKRSRFGWFLGCTGYPDCKTTLPMAGKDSVDCPTGCGGKVSQKRSRKGRSFWGCSNYPSCDFVSWYKPLLEACPSCGNKFLEDKPLKSGHIKQCPKCKHKIEVEEHAGS